MKRPYQISGIVLFAFSVFIAWESLTYVFYTDVGPGPGFFPFWVAAIMGLLSVVVFLQGTFHHTNHLPEDFIPNRQGYLRIMAIVAALIGAIMLMNSLGFRLCMLGFTLFLFFALGRQRLVVAVPIALLGSFGIFYVFDELLKVPLPVGMLGI
ncbi:MAG: tripartite tricarboxylate transporter TctB family protein [Chloroflexota bacterium]|jgi:putative tricarboxylic transport membrane protein